MLEPEVIADAIVSQVVSGYGSQIFCPSNLSIISGIRGFPHWLQEAVRGAQKNVLQL
jgi:all-trans-retinol dehydrogenase (NAD+)